MSRSKSLRPSGHFDMKNKYLQSLKLKNPLKHPFFETPAGLVLFLANDCLFVNTHLVSSTVLN